MLAYMNQEAFQKTLDTGKMTYYSRSRQCLVGQRRDLRPHPVRQIPCIWTATTTPFWPKCTRSAPPATPAAVPVFTRPLVSREYRDANPLKVFEEVMAVIQDRKEHPKEGSYTNYLFDKGLDKILKKVGEEAAEIIIASKIQIRRNQI